MLCFIIIIMPGRYSSEVPPVAGYRYCRPGDLPAVIVLLDIQPAISELITGESQGFSGLQGHLGLSLEKFDPDNPQAHQDDANVNDVTTVPPAVMDSELPEGAQAGLGLSPCPQPY